MKKKPGCLAGLFKLILLDNLYDWLQKKFGFGRGCSCAGLGCGFILLVLVLLIAFSILTHTDWLRLF